MEYKGFSTNARAVIFFLIGIVLILGSVYYITGRSLNPYFFTPDFRDAGTDKYLVLTRIPQRQMNDLKIQHVIKHGAPDIAMFGNHGIRRITASAMGLSPGDEFFNMYTDHIGLPGVRDLLFYLENHDALPKKAVLVSIPNPHSASGPFTNIWVYELPTYVYSADRLGTNRYARVYARAIADIRDRWDWRNVVYEVFADFIVGCPVPYGFREFDLPRKYKRIGYTEWDKFLTKLNGRRISTQICSPLSGWRSDGSFIWQQRKYVNWALPTVNKGSWERYAKQQKPYIEGDPAPMIDAMRDIAALSKRNNLKLAYFIAPVFEVDRDSNDSRSMDRALAQVSNEMLILNHRKVPRGPEDFYDYLHPTDGYVKRYLAKELRQAGILPASSVKN